MTKQSNVMCSFGVTKSHFNRLISSIDKQVSLDLLNGFKRKSEIFLVTDANYDDVPDIIKAYFSSKIITVNPFLKEKLNDTIQFSYGRIRNAAIKYALDNQADWLVLCDCDTIFAGNDFGPFHAAMNFPKVYWQKNENESVFDSVNFIQSSNGDCFSNGNSWFIIGRSIMENVSFNEEIFGYGYEDIDFDHRVRLSGHDIGQTDFVIIHNYHSHEERKIDPVRFQKNKYIVEYTSKLIENHQIIFKYKNIDYVKVINPFWESDLILMWDTKRLMHRDNGNFGDYELDGDVLHVKWDNFSPERYRKSGDAFEFIEES